MKKITIPLCRSYPVGENIQSYLPTIRGMIKAIKALDKKDIKLCCRGSSGAIISGIIAAEIPECEIIHVKKDGETSHTYNSEYTILPSDYIIYVDDFVSSGSTMLAINRALNTHRVDCVCIGGLCCEEEQLYCKMDFDFEVLIVGEKDTK
jgi:adenine/guanine phosphoribosyltransferase-like PRPP-binding protein